VKGFLIRISVLSTINLTLLPLGRQRTPVDLLAEAMHQAEEVMFSSLF
jgi:hypothetical protein